MTEPRDNNDGYTELHRAAGCNDTAALRGLLKAGADINCVDKYLRTPLYMAVDSGAFAAVDYLLQIGANAEIADENGQTPLLRAASVGDSRMVRKLLEAGADAGVKDNMGSTAESIARGNQYFDISESIRAARAAKSRERSP